MSFVYVINISSFDNFDSSIMPEFIKFTPPEIHEKINRYHFKADAYRCLLGELLKRYMICSFLDVKNDRVSIKYNDFQKPILDNVSNCFFNISHSGDYIAGIIDSGLSGIDIEQITEIDMKIAEKFFHIKEKDIIQKLDRIQEQNKRFFLIWTMKEAYIKALGIGLSKSLNSFYVQIDSSGSISIIDEDAAAAQFTHLDNIFIKDGHVLSSVASSSPEYIFLSDIELLSSILQSGFF